MVHYCVVIPQRNCVERVTALVAELETALDSLLLPYEIICVDDGSDACARLDLEALGKRHSALRLLYFDQPRGTSAALSAGIAAARGDLVIAVGASGRPSIGHLARLIAELSQYDLVTARQQKPLGSALWSRTRCWLGALLGLAQSRTDEVLYWVATRRAVANLGLARGAFRFLPELVACRGLRVCQLTISADRPVRSRAVRVGILTRLAARWLDRFEPHRASEASQAAGRPLPAALRGLSRSRSAPPATVALSEIKSTNPL
jgi:glycosyltransferase involved in cell wall biosynthesis